MSAKGEGGAASGALSGEDLTFAYNLGLENNNELTQQLLTAQGWSREKIVALFNRLNDARAGVLRKRGSVPALKKLDAFDYRIYCAIELAGNAGVWTADIRKSTGLQTHVIQRGVRNLCENLNLIKPVKSILVKNRKMYILAHMEPAKEIAGGSFYINGDFNEQLVEHLREKLSTFLKNARSSTFSNLVAYVRSSGDASGGGSFSDEDLRQLISTLEFEGKVARVETAGEATFVWCASEGLSLTGSAPCLGCPYIDNCFAGGARDPKDCEYLSTWLHLENKVAAPSEAREAV